jgi:hypothetical protein
MKYLRYVAILALLALPLALARPAQAEVRFGVGVGFGPGYVAGPPVCAYGYYPDYPYACAPYGYYGPEWFADGIFIGAGPWYHGWGHPYYGRGFDHDRFYGHDGRAYARGFSGRGYEGRGAVIAHGGAERSFAGHSFAGHAAGGGFRGGSRGGARGR